MSSLVERYRRTKLIELAEADKKVIHLEEKEIKDSAWKQAPEVSREIVDGKFQ